MDKYAIIKLKMEGVSNRQVAKILGIDRKTVADYWNEYSASLEKLGYDSNSEEDLRALQSRMLDAPRYDSSSRRPKKYTAELDAYIDEILAAEEEKKKLLGWKKQQLTGVQIYEMVKDAGYDIGRSTLNAYLKEKRQKYSETFIRQEYDFGDRLEYDFGEVVLIIADEKDKYHMAVFGAPRSRFRWAYLYKNQRKAVFLDSHVRFFEMIGGVYKEVVYDNMKNVVSKFIGRNEKELNPDLLKMSLYYDYNINVTNCFSGNEKGFVEGSVKELRKELFNKQYKFDSFEAAEKYMQERLIELNKDSLIEEEKKHLKPIKPKLELGTISRQVVDKYSFVRIENNFYSVPDYLVGREVTIKNYLRELLVYADSGIVAKHKKVDGFGEMQINIFHYLDTLAKKPGAVKNSKALKSKAELKTIYDTYFTKRTKEFIDILKENQELSYEALQEILISRGKTAVVYESSPPKTIEENITRQTKTQISKLSELLLKGGAEYVN